jgi:hypothetical protein
MFSVYRKSKFSNSKIVSKIVTIVSIFILFEDERACGVLFASEKAAEMIAHPAAPLLPYI